MTYNGYAGTILFVDLTTGQVKKRPTDLDMAKHLLGGFGVNKRLAYETLKPGTDPFSPENVIILGAGPLVGTNAPGGSRVIGTTRFPLTGAVASGSGSMSFGPQMKWAGYDHVVITGRAKSPVYLLIRDEEVTLQDARELWGRDIVDTTDALWATHGKCGVVAIGQAGENLVRFSLAMVDKTATLGKHGLSAVMGSKNLKAIVALGSKGVNIADRQRFKKVVDRLYERVKAYPERQEVNDLGIMSNFNNYAQQLFVRKNWDEIVPADEVTSQYGLPVYEKALKHRAGCPSCFLCHRDVLEVPEGEYKGLRMDMHSFLQIARLGTRFGIAEYDKATKLFDLLNRYGLCYHTVMNMGDFLIEMHDRGRIEDRKVEGLPLRRDFDAVKSFIEQVTFRQGVGDALADGWPAVFDRFGEGLRGEAMIVKSADAIRDPRVSALGTHQFSEIVCPRGPQSASGTGPSYMPGQSVERFKRHSERMGASQERIQRMFPEGAEINIPRMTKASEDWYTLLNSLGICEMHLINRFYHIDTCVELFAAATGFELNAQELMTGAERGWNIFKVLNAREGFARKDDAVPAKWLQPLVTARGEIRLSDYYGTKTISGSEIEGMLDDYYEERGWDKVAGTPTRERLLELELADLAKDSSVNSAGVAAAGEGGEARQ